MNKIRNKAQIGTFLSICLIIFGIILSAWFFLFNDLVFHTDVARDFLLFENIVHEKPFTLIGPRAGGIPGVFHGPLWLYVNIPAFIIGQGNPVVVGWGWLIFFIGSIYGMWYVSKKLFGHEVALLSTVLYTFVTAGLVKASFNPSGAVYLSPLFFYFLYLYLKESNKFHLALTYFILGLIIQFQMAFGVPIGLITTAIVLFHIVKRKEFIHIFFMSTILIPLSSYILFELKHDFLQIRSVLNFLTGVENAGKVHTTTSKFLIDRFQGFTRSGISFIGHNIPILILATWSTIIAGLISRKKSTNDKLIYFLIISLYLGFWASTLVFKGVIWSYYYWPLTPLLIIFIASTYKYIDKRIFFVAYALLLGFNIFNVTKEIYQASSYIGTGRTGGTWQYYYKPAQDIFASAPSEFGYFIYTADQFGYSSRYAMNYAQKANENKIARPFQKSGKTYLLTFPAHDHPYTNEKWWKAGQVKIDRKPNKVFKYDRNFYIEEYDLTEEEVQVTPDPNLLHTIIFR